MTTTRSTTRIQKQEKPVLRYMEFNWDNSSDEKCSSKLKCSPCNCILLLLTSSLGWLCQPNWFAFPLWVEFIFNINCIPNGATLQCILALSSPHNLPMHCSVQLNATLPCHALFLLLAMHVGLWLCLYVCVCWPSMHFCLF